MCWVDIAAPKNNKTIVSVNATLFFVIGMNKPTRKRNISLLRALSPWGDFRFRCGNLRIFRKTLCFPICLTMCTCAKCVVQEIRNVLGGHRGSEKYKNICFVGRDIIFRF